MATDSAPTKRRVWHQTKQGWAEAKVVELELELAKVIAQHVPASKWRDVQRKTQHLASLRKDIDRYRALAKLYADRRE